MEGDPLLFARQLLVNTAEHGFLQASTIAALFGLEERLLVLLVERLGGEVHIPDLAELLTQPAGEELVAELTEEGTYVLRLEPAGP